MTIQSAIRRTARGLCVAALIFSSLGFWSAAQAVGALNDTGVTSCSNGTTTVACSSVDATHPGQDASFGRDAAAATGALTKLGSGPVGFDFTKLDISGAVVPDSAAMGSAAGQHACTRDNVTGLVWDVLLTVPANGASCSGSCRTWYDPNSATNGGFAGSNTLGGTNVSATAANASGQCGGTGWRLPTVRELLSISDMGQGNRPAGYFASNTPSGCAGYKGVVWSSQTVRGNSSAAWLVSQSGNLYALNKDQANVAFVCSSWMYAYTMIVR